MYSQDVDAQTYITPTLVVLVGFERAESEAEAIRQGVQTRIDPDYPPDALGWLLLSSDPDDIHDRLTDVADTLTDDNFWRYMVTRGLLPAEYRTLQVIVVCNLADLTSPDTIAPFLNTLTQELKETFGALNPRIMLVALGEEKLVGHLDEDSLAGYDLRVQMGKHVYGGTWASRKRVLEACQTLIVALIISNLATTLIDLRYQQNPPSKWLSIGASALAVNIPQMRRYLQLLIFRRLIQPILRPEVPHLDIEQQAIQDEMLTLATGFRAALLGQVVASANANNWSAELEEQPPDALPTRLGRFQLGQKLASQILGDYKDLRNALAGEYNILRDNLARALNNIESEYSTRATRLACEILTSRAESRNLLNTTPYLESLESPQVRTAALYRASIPGMTLAVTSLLDVLSEFGTTLPLGKQHILPFSICGDRFLATVALWDASFVQNNRLSVGRFVRSMASIPGLVLRLVPAWPILTGVVVGVSGWDQVTSLAVAGSAVGVLGAGEAAGWRREMRNFRQRKEEESLARIANSGLSILARGADDARTHLSNRLTHLRFDLARLSRVLERHDDRTESEIDHIWSDKHEVEAIYWLADFRRCIEWVDAALQTASTDNVLTTLICEKITPYFEHSISVTRVVTEIEATTEKLAQRTFDDQMLYPEMLVTREEYQDDLGDGRSWQWLEQAARPLGNLEAAGVHFTYVLASGAALVGNRASGYWKEDWVPLTPLQRRDVIFIKGVC